MTQARAARNAGDKATSGKHGQAGHLFTEGQNPAVPEISFGDCCLACSHGVLVGDSQFWLPEFSRAPPSEVFCDSKAMTMLAPGAWTGLSIADAHGILPNTRRKGSFVEHALCAECLYIGFHLILILKENSI